MAKRSGSKKTRKAGTAKAPAAAATPLGDQVADPGAPTPDEYPPAGFGRRMGAMVYDLLLLFGIWFLSTMVLVLINKLDVVTGPPLMALLFLETTAFFAFFWMRDGRTTGMMAWRLWVQQPDGQRITLPQALARIVGGVFSLLTLGLGWVWILLDAQNRSWSDLYSRTRVVLGPK